MNQYKKAILSHYKTLSRRIDSPLVQLSYLVVIDELLHDSAYSTHSIWYYSERGWFRMRHTEPLIKTEENLEAILEIIGEYEGIDPILTQDEKDMISLLAMYKISREFDEDEDPQVIISNLMEKIYEPGTLL